MKTWRWFLWSFLSVFLSLGASRALAEIVVLNEDQTDYEFFGTNTYYITNWVTISGAATFDAGTVIKYGPYGILSVYAVDCETTSNNPAIFTARDDDTVGDILPDSTHVPPLTGYGDGWVSPDTALALNNIGNDLHDLVISYAICGIYFPGDWNEDVTSTMEDVNIRDCNLLFYADEGVPVDISDSRFSHGIIDGDTLYLTWSNVVLNDVWIQDDGLGAPYDGSYFVNSLLANTHFDWNTTITWGTSNQFFSSDLFGDNYQILTLHAPTAYDQIVSTLPNNSVDITLTADSPDSKPLTYIVIGSPLHGRLSGTPPNLTYTPNTDYLGPDDFTFTVDDGVLDSTNAMVFIAVDEPIDFHLIATNNFVQTNNVAFQITWLSGLPSYKAILVNDTNFSSATWSGYAGTNLTANLGSMSNGDYTVWVGLQSFSGELAWQSIEFTIDTNPPLLLITNPVVASGGTATLGVPLIQIQGEANERLSSLTYDISNAVSVVTNIEGDVMQQFFDTNKWDFTTNYFQCFDITLATNLNFISIHATDLAGNVRTTNLLLNLDLSTRTNPPVVGLNWPQDGMKVGVTNITVNGYVDDPTATIVASITDTNGDTNVLSGVIERDGRFWVDNVPLGSGTNELTLTITDAAGNVTVTNLAVVPSAVTFTINSPTSDKLWRPFVDLTGNISDPNQAVWVNGVKGHNNGDGTWSAHDVPVTEGGVALFKAVSYEATEQQPDGSYGNP